MTGPNKKRLPKQQVTDLFYKIQSCYGQKWSNRFGDNKLLDHAKNEWAIELVIYSQQTIDSALYKWRKHQPSFPPTLDEFAGCCKDVQMSKVNGLPKEEIEKSNRSIGKSSLDEIRKALR